MLFYLNTERIYYQKGKTFDFSRDKKIINKPTLIDLIVIGLPNYISHEIDRDKLK